MDFDDLDTYNGDPVNDGWVDFDYHENTGELSGLFEDTDLDQLFGKKKLIDTTDTLRYHNPRRKAELDERYNALSDRIDALDRKLDNIDPDSELYDDVYDDIESLRDELDDIEEERDDFDDY